MIFSAQFLMRRMPALSASDYLSILLVYLWLGTALFSIERKIVKVSRDGALTVQLFLDYPAH